MPSSASRPIDAVEELRLRCWARRNYVPVWNRIPTWDPIILEEMQNRDDELAAMDPLDAIASMLVPLEPDFPLLLHPAHAELPAPNLLSQRIAATERVEPYYF